VNWFSQSESRKCVVAAVHTCSSDNDAGGAVQKSVRNVVFVSTVQVNRTSASAVGLPYWPPYVTLHIKI